jgi:WD40 repeat protein
MGLADGTIKLWRTADWTPAATFDAHDARGGITSLAFNSDGSLLAASSEDRTWSLSTLKPGKILFRSRRHTATMSGAEFGADGVLHTLDYDGRMRSWALDDN